MPYPPSPDHPTKTIIMKTTKNPDHNPTGRTRPKRKLGTVLRAKLSRYRARVSERSQQHRRALARRPPSPPSSRHRRGVGAQHLVQEHHGNGGNDRHSALPAHRPANPRPRRSSRNGPPRSPGGSRRPGDHHPAGTGSGRAHRQAGTGRSDPDRSGTYPRCRPGGRSGPPHRAHG